LWSAHCLITHPQLITDIHLKYLENGADIITTCSYQASFEGFENIGIKEKEASELLERSVFLARNAVRLYRERHCNDEQQCLSSCLIAASIGPYGAYLADGSEYSGKYVDTTSPETLRRFHLRRLRTLVNTPGVDVLAMETMPSLNEVLLVLEIIKIEGISIPVWVSFSAKHQQFHDDMNSSTALNPRSCTSASADASLLTTRHGEPITTAVQSLEQYPQVVAVGVNCISPFVVTPFIRAIRAVTKKSIIVYPNSGEKWDSQKKEWIPHYPPQSAPSFEMLALEWYEAGANIIGGCCRTTPTDIKQISTALSRLRTNIFVTF